jgi:hypothetical protein
MLMGLSLFVLSGMLFADDTNINVNIDSKGSATLKDQDLKTQEYLKDKEKS